MTTPTFDPEAYFAMMEQMLGLSIERLGGRELSPISML